jgi:cytochrome P450
MQVGSGVPQVSPRNGADCPEYPMQRDRRPFDPPSGLAQLQAEAPISWVTLWDGSTPWLFTRYEDVRAVLADPRVSVNNVPVTW